MNHKHIAEVIWYFCNGDKESFKDNLYQCKFNMDDAQLIYMEISKIYPEKF